MLIKPEGITLISQNMTGTLKPYAALVTVKVNMVYPLQGALKGRGPVHRDEGRYSWGAVRGCCLIGLIIAVEAILNTFTELMSVQRCIWSPQRNDSMCKKASGTYSAWAFCLFCNTGWNRLCSVIWNPWQYCALKQMLWFFFLMIACFDLLLCHF